MKNITVVLGSARKGRQSDKVYKLLGKYFGERVDVNLTMVDVKDHVTLPETVPSWGIGGADENPTEWKEIVGATGAFVFVLPEYNHGYPGEWKLLVDSLGGKDYDGKHAFIAGVSGGIFAGVRVADHVKSVLVELNLVPHKTALYMGNIKTALDAEGNTDDKVMIDRVSKFVDAVVSVG